MTLIEIVYSNGETRKLSVKGNATLDCTSNAVLVNDSENGEIIAYLNITDEIEMVRKIGQFEDDEYDDDDCDCEDESEEEYEDEDESNDYDDDESDEEDEDEDDESEDEESDDEDESKKMSDEDIEKTINKIFKDLFGLE